MAGSVGESIQDAASLLADAGIDSPYTDARLIMARALGKNVTQLIAHPELIVPDDVQATFQAMVRDRGLRKPLAYVLGEWQFYGLGLKVTPDVLVPRPETELLVDATLSRLTPQNPRIADIGTGTGAIAIALAANLDSAQLTATDASANALQVARSNVEKYNLGSRIILSQGDLLDPLRGRGPFDAIVSNPPYVRQAELVNPQPEIGWEPQMALDGGEDGLDIYRRLLPNALELLNEAGFVAVEVGMGQAEDVSRIAMEAGYSRTERLTDLAGIERVVVAWK